jgi:hypothetical protein
MTDARCVQNLRVSCLVPSHQAPQRKGPFLPANDDVNPIASTAAFAHFQDGHAERRDGPVDQQTAELVGAYVTTID